MIISLLVCICVSHLLWKLWTSYTRTTSIFQTGETLEDKETLLVIAHPDDESMFFVPTILQEKNLHVLCLSSGDFHGLGKVREQELRDVGKYLNIRTVTILDHPHLRDGFWLW